MCYFDVLLIMTIFNTNFFMQSTTDDHILVSIFVCLNLSNIQDISNKFLTFLLNYPHHLVLIIQMKKDCYYAVLYYTVLY